jgi:hypothetical protein
MAYLIHFQVHSESRGSYVAVRRVFTGGTEQDAVDGLIAYLHLKPGRIVRVEPAP